MEQFKIINSTLEDIDTIFKLYDEGTAYQKSVAKTSWKGFERPLVEIEIKKKTMENNNRWTNSGCICNYF